MTDKQCVEVLKLLDCYGLARTARDISVKRIEAWYRVPEEIDALTPQPKSPKLYTQGFEDAKRFIQKIIKNHRKEQNW